MVKYRFLSFYVTGTDTFDPIHRYGTEILHPLLSRERSASGEVRAIDLCMHQRSGSNRESKEPTVGKLICKTYLASRSTKALDITISCKNRLINYGFKIL